MKPVMIDNGYTTLRLPLTHWASLSRACWFASEEGLDPDLDHWRTLATLFHCCATAGPPAGRLAPPAIVRPELAYLTWQADTITLKLSARQCASLARACCFAGQESPDKEAALWSLLGGLFHACAVAGFAQWHMRPGEAAVLAEQLMALDLQEMKLAWWAEATPQSMPVNEPVNGSVTEIEL